MSVILDSILQAQIAERPQQIGIIVVLVAGALITVWLCKKYRFIILALVAVVCLVANHYLHKWAVPWYLILAAAVPITALIGIFTQKYRRRTLALTFVLTLIAELGLINVQYQMFPTIGSLNPRPVAKSMSYEEFQGLQDFHQAAIVNVNLPGTTSGFHARDAKVYLPPAYFEGATLPVLVLLNGDPGGPSQWFGSGQAPQTANAFQKANNGVSPIVIAVDATGAQTADPICADSQVAKVMTYLATDVPAAIKTKFHVDENQMHWSVGGLSYGGTCTLQIFTNRPEAYGYFVDISGEPEPTMGNHTDTVNKFFGGDEQAYQNQNPAYLLAHADPAKYAGRKVIFIAGEKDTMARPALKQLSDAARKAGVSTDYVLLPGGHSFAVWRKGLRLSFAWIARQGGVSNVTDPFNGVKDEDLQK